LHHALAINGVEAVEKDKIPSAGVPLFVFQQFLSHKEHGHPGRGKQDGIGHPAAASGVPGAAVVRVGTKRNAGISTDLHLVMVFNASHCAPEIWQIVGTERQSRG
jgi:hypothetical protein